MRQALIVYESMFGDNEKVAYAIAQGLATGMRVDVMEVSSAPPRVDSSIDLLVVGGPTHMTRLSTERSRHRAEDESEEDWEPLSESGVREWLAGLKARGEVGRGAAAAFGTNLQEPKWLSKVGQASRAIGRRLKHLGFELIEAPQTFFVEGTEGPLVEGEAERAHRFGVALARHFGEAPRPHA
ncbi:flavodoxin [Lujinxingia litoralis]|uniref:Flavodoxin n=1 Tax=Lujinxingia litoralis TaxID=2211119 RepID=A0A328C8L2_9DELT|nr:flavodoxin domain-containing protein [Lujinxingia litoralis]RAL23010.1 flavodoxin [Lujinxingia litoralis]